MPHILIVEDEAAIADTLIFALQGEGFTTTWLSLGQEALAHQRQTPADLIILDIGLPDISGFETCKQLRRFSEVPVMFLSARDSEIDRVVGLEIGADDYVVKPFSPREVAARVRAILKRMAPRDIAAANLGASWTEFRDHLSQIRKRGYAETFGKVNPGMHSIAVPVLRDDGRVVGSLLTLGSAAREKAEAALKQVPLLIRKADQMQKALSVLDADAR